MSFVRNFWRDAPKNGEVGPCSECGVLNLEALVRSSPIDPEITDGQVKGQPQLTGNCCRNQHWFKFVFF